MDQDPYRYFRIEARELLDELAQGFLDLEKGQRGAELIGRLLRQAHTLKGAARVVKQITISELAHHMEDILAPWREGRQPIAAEPIARLLQLVDQCADRLKELLAPSEQAGAPPVQAGAPPAAPDSEKTLTSMRVDIADMDALLNDLGEAGVHLASLRDDLGEMDRMLRAGAGVHEPDPAPRHPGGVAGRLAANAARPGDSTRPGVGFGLGRLCRSLQAQLERVERDVARARARAGALRLLPASTVFPALERSVRDVAEATNKRVVFDAHGGQHRLDAHVLVALRDALLHVARNAVAHGIESEEERGRAGKPPAGRVSLRVEKLGPQVRFLVQDDGCGLDVAAIRQVAVQRGLVSRAEAGALDLAEATRLLLRGGMSTAADVSLVAGRGVGLDVVRATAARLKGEVTLGSEPGRGTTVALTVPVSIESMNVLAVAAHDTTALIPFHAIRQALLVKEKDLLRSSASTSLVVGDETIPFGVLGTLLNGRRPGWEKPGAWPSVVLQAGGVRAAVGVDRLEGIRNVVLRPLPALCGRVRLVTGAALDGAGNPELLLDPAGLILAIRGAHGAPADSGPTVRPNVLVIDDSLTTRMLEQSILEAAGYAVDLAVSGKEALAKARQKKYALFVVDVEMPEMDGFELLAAFRSDPEMSAVPAIMVTSRATAEDRRRGEEAGARAYIVKSEFDEGRLLEVIRELVAEVVG